MNLEENLDGMVHISDIDWEWKWYNRGGVGPVDTLPIFFLFQEKRKKMETVEYRPAKLNGLMFGLFVKIMATGQQENIL